MGKNMAQLVRAQKLNKTYGRFWNDCAKLSVSPYTRVYNAIIDNFENQENDEDVGDISALVGNIMAFLGTGFLTIVPVLPLMTAITLAAAILEVIVSMISMVVTYPIALTKDLLSPLALENENEAYFIKRDDSNFIENCYKDLFDGCLVILFFGYVIAASFKNPKQDNILGTLSALFDSIFASPLLSLSMVVTIPLALGAAILTLASMLVIYPLAFALEPLSSLDCFVSNDVASGNEPRVC